MNIIPQREFWIGRWERGQTGWHQKDVEPALIRNFQDLPPSRVFVPLCGKSRDLAWLAAQGHQVIGVELSPLACRSFFAEHQLPFQESNEGKFRVLRGERITILNGDFFELSEREIGKLGAVYDRAALIALPPEIRTSYAEKMIRIVREARGNGPLAFLQIALELSPPASDGPPFSISAIELDRLYGRNFEILPLSRETVDLGPGSQAAPNAQNGQNAITPAEECVYSLTWRGEFPDS